MSQYKIYLAGPLFSFGERDFNLTIERVCVAAGFEVFLPQRDAPVLTATNHDEVFGAELKAIHAADLIVANLDGMDVDSGTAWYIGYAIASIKSVIGIRTDWRRFSKHESVNLMIEQSASIIVIDLNQLASALLAWLPGEQS
jgi:nucleoside 2-deoxyribosyltransferase